MVSTKMAMSTKDYCKIPCKIPVAYTRISLEHHYKMRQWLIDNIDPTCYNAEDFTPLEDDYLKRNIWFANFKDAVWFSLTWA